MRGAGSGLDAAETRRIRACRRTRSPSLVRRRSWAESRPERAATWLALLAPTGGHWATSLQ